MGQLPLRWINTLDSRREASTFDYVIAGHGDVMRDKQTFELWKQYFRDLLDRPPPLTPMSATRTKLKSACPDYLMSKYAAKFDAEISRKMWVPK